MHALDTKERIACITEVPENVYLQLENITEIPKGKFSQDTSKTNAGIEDGNECCENYHGTSPQRLEENVLSENNNKLTDQMPKCTKFRVLLLTVSLSLALVLGTIVIFLLFYKTSSIDDGVAQYNVSEPFVNTEGTSVNSSQSNCTQTSSNELFWPMQRYTDSDIKRYTRVSRNIFVLSHITYDLKDIQQHVRNKTYKQCVKNPSASVKTTHYLSYYYLSATLIYFNRSNVKSPVMYSRVPMIDVDCNLDVYQSPETVSFQYLSEIFKYLNKVRRRFMIKENRTITLPPFSKYTELVNVPIVELLFPYTGVMQKYDRGILRNTYSETGEVIVKMYLKNSITKNYALHEGDDSCY